MLSASHLPRADPLSTQLLTCLGVGVFLPTFTCLFLVWGCYRPDVKTGVKTTTLPHISGQVHGDMEEGPQAGYGVSIPTM